MTIDIEKIAKIATICLASTVVLDQPLRASQLRDGTVFFEKYPRLMEADSTFTKIAIVSINTLFDKSLQPLF